MAHRVTASSNNCVFSSPIGYRTRSGRRGQAHFRLDTLRFPSDEWSPADISGLLKGLFEAGKDNRDATIALLRKLRLHTQRGALNERVSIAAGNGALDERFVLDQAGFEDQLPNDLRPLWHGFLAETKIIERLPEDDLASTVQKYLFERVNESVSRPLPLRQESIAHDHLQP